MQNHDSANSPCTAVVGTGGHAVACSDVLRTNATSICSFWISQSDGGGGIALMASSEAPSGTVTDFLLPLSHDLDKHFEFHKWIVAIGDAVVRERLVLAIRERFVSPSFPPLVSRSASVSAEASIAQGAQILDGAHIGPNSRVGEFSIVNSNATLEHHATLGDFSHLAPGSVVLGAASVGNRCLVGANAVIAPKVSLGDDSILGALGFHSRSTIEPGVFLGVPSARQFPVE